MAEDMTALQHLEALLNERNRRIEELEDKLAEAERRLQQEDPYWSLPVQLPEEQTLPVPRLEMVVEWDEERSHETLFTYRLVYRHLLGHCVGLILGFTPRYGCNGPPIRKGKIDMPMRDGRHIERDARTLNLPAFAVYGGRVEPIEPDAEAY